jgi:hypothetical protein
VVKDERRVVKDGRLVVKDERRVVKDERRVVKDERRVVKDERRVTIVCHSRQRELVDSAEDRDRREEARIHKAISWPFGSNRALI